MTELPISDTHTILVFSRDDPRRTTIFNHHSSQVAYTVFTDGNDERPAKSTLVISDAQGSVVATARIRALRADLLTFADGTSVSETDWLKKSVITDSATFRSGTGAQYKWKVDKTSQNMSLYAEDQSEQPLATYKKRRYEVASPASTLDLRSWSTATLVPTTSEYPPHQPVKEAYRVQHVPATLALSPSVALMQDLIVVSYILFQRSRRPPGGVRIEDDVSFSPDTQMFSATVTDMENMRSYGTAIDESPISAFGYL